jgi:hypothetical protein
LVLFYSHYSQMAMMLILDFSWWSPSAFTCVFVLCFLAPFHAFVCTLMTTLTHELTVKPWFSFLSSFQVLAAIRAMRRTRLMQQQLQQAPAVGGGVGVGNNRNNPVDVNNPAVAAPADDDAADEDAEIWEQLRAAEEEAAREQRQNEENRAQQQQQQQQQPALEGGLLKNMERFVIGFFASLFPAWQPPRPRPVAGPRAQ